MFIPPLANHHTPMNLGCAIARRQAQNGRREQSPCPCRRAASFRGDGIMRSRAHVRDHRGRNGRTAATGRLADAGLAVTPCSRNRRGAPRRDATRRLLEGAFTRSTAHRAALTSAPATPRFAAPSRAGCEAGTTTVGRGLSRGMSDRSCLRCDPGHRQPWGLKDTGPRYVSLWSVAMVSAPPSMNSRQGADRRSPVL